MSKFEIIGTLSLSKGSEKMPTFETIKVGDSGEKRILRLNSKSDDNFHNVKIEGLCWGNDSQIFAKKKVGEGKYEDLKFKYSERDKHIAELAEFSKYVFVDGDTRHEFATQYDFALFVKEELESGKYNDKRFIIKGDVESSQWKGKSYHDFNVTRLYTVTEKEGEEAIEDKSEATLELFLGEGCLMDDDFEETRKMFLNGFNARYDSKKKGRIGIPLTVEVYVPKEKKNGAKLVDKFKENTEGKITDDELAYKLGIKVDMVSKSEKVEFNMELLSDEEREDLELGLLDLEELKAEHGCGKGAFERKFVFKTFARGYSKGAIEQDGLKIAELLALEKSESDNGVSYSVDEEDDVSVFEPDTSSESDEWDDL